MRAFPCTIDQADSILTLGSSPLLSGSPSAKPSSEPHSARRLCLRSFRDASFDLELLEAEWGVAETNELIEHQRLLLNSSRDTKATTPLRRGPCSTGCS